jgi:3',5'-cyclic AMP phosphodiesterase CpdA
MKLSKKEKWIFPLLAVLVLLATGFFIISKNNSGKKPDISAKKEITVGIVTDIHAGPDENGHKEVGNENAIVHPVAYKNSLKPLLDSKPDLIITLGDNVNDNDKCHPYADNLKLLFSKFNVLWGRGNHDKDCFPFFSSQNYYYQDYDNTGWRIIMLDDDIDVDANEISWLKETLKTDKKVLIATHVPFFSPSRDENTLLPQYTDAEKVISESGNVRYVLSGHLHSRLWDKVYNGVHYYILPSVSGDAYPKYFMKLTLN